MSAERLRDCVKRWWAELGLLMLLGLMAVWPMRAALVDAGVPGAGPDVVSTLWGMWWFQQEWVGAAWSGWTGLVNHPYGAYGTVLSPSSALTWALSEPLLGVGWAAVLAAVVQLVALAAGTAWLALQAGAERWGAAVAAVGVLVGRYLFFGLGEGSVVAIAAAPIPLGLAALWQIRNEARGRWAAAGAALCMLWTATENPYLAPVLPVMASALVGSVAYRHWRAPGPEHRRQLQLLLGALVAGSLAVLVISIMFSRSANPDYPRDVAGEIANLGPLSFSVVDMSWARATPLEWWWPGEVRWTTDSEGGVSATGGRYLGLVVLLLSLVAGWKSPRRALPWLLLSGVGLALSLGSLYQGIGVPFIFLNALMSEVARPLTQPTRFLVLSVIGLSVCAGLGTRVVLQHFDTAKRRWVGLGLLGLLLTDSVLLGGLSLTLPVTSLPELPCAASFSEREDSGDTRDDGVLIWPWDAVDGEQSQSQLYQLQHGLRTAHTGIASWALHRARVTTELRSAGWRIDGRGGELDRRLLRELGYRWMIVEVAADPEGATWLSSQLGPPTEQCGPVAVHFLAGPSRYPPPDSEAAAEDEDVAAPSP